MLPERIAMTSFTVPISADEMYLMLESHQVKHEDTFFEIMHKPFAPFDNALWLAVIGFLIFSGHSDVLKAH